MQRGPGELKDAHSGATIGAGEPCDEFADPEVPFACPTILQQVTNDSLDPADAARVLVNGGVNDVTVQRIINPFAKPSDIRRVTRHYCHRDMALLLRELLARFDAKIIVTSYFPIFSQKSKVSQVFDVLDAYMIAVPRGSDFSLQRQFSFERIVEDTQAFWSESAAALQDAIRDVGSNRVHVANVPVADDNAMFAFRKAPQTTRSNDSTPGPATPRVAIESVLITAREIQSLAFFASADACTSAPASVSSRSQCRHHRAHALLLWMDEGRRRASHR